MEGMKISVTYVLDSSQAAQLERLFKLWNERAFSGESSLNPMETPGSLFESLVLSDFSRNGHYYILDRLEADLHGQGERPSN